MTHDALYYSTATVGPVLYLAFTVELLRYTPPKFSKPLWVLRIVNAIFYGAALIVIEAVSLLVLTGGLRDVRSWRLAVIFATMAFVVALTTTTLTRVIGDRGEVNGHIETGPTDAL